LHIETPKIVLYAGGAMPSILHKPLKRRSDLHIPRKILHAGGVLAMVILYNHISRPAALTLMALGTLIFAGLDVGRQYSSNVNRALLLIFHPFMREHERHRLAGTTYLWIGVLMIVALFPPAIVNLSLLFLAVADPLASLVGILYGRDKILGQKSLQGTCAAFLACTLIAAVYFYTRQWMTERLVIVSLLAGFIGALAELVPVFDIDDNLTFPVVSSSLLFGLFWIFGGF
jgi:diacylglycerol kinase (CTP)